MKDNEMKKTVEGDNWLEQVPPASADLPDETDLPDEADLSDEADLPTDEETTVGETTPNDKPVTSEDDAPTEEASKETPTEENTTGEATPAEDTASKGEAPTEEAFSEEEALAEDTPVEDAPVDEEEAPAEPPVRTLSIKPVTMADSLRSDDTVNSMMTDVLVALLPILVWAVYLYGLRPLVLTGLSVVTCYVTELLGRLIFRRKVPMDLTPAVTGVMIALGMPATAPLWLPLLSAAIAILPIRQFFGGTGRNRLNPAATALAILYIFFPRIMTAFCPTGVRLPAFAMTVSGYETVGTTALDTLLSGALPEQSMGSMLVGLRTGLMGEMAALLLIAGGIYLVVRKVIRPGLPVAFILTVAALTYLFPTLEAASDVMALRYAVYHLLCGNLLLGAIFMATDPVTSPRSGRTSIIAGVIGGAVTVAIRYYVSPHIGVICAILVINLLSRILDYLTRPSLFGGRRKKKS